MPSSEYQNLPPEEFSNLYDIPLDAAPTELFDIEVYLDGIEGDTQGVDISHNRRKFRRSSAVAWLVVSVLSAGMGNVMQENFVEAECIDTSADINLHPEYNQVFEQVSEIDFIENEPSRLSLVEAAIDDAKDLEIAKDIAKSYLGSLGVKLDFDILPGISLRRLHALNLYNRISINESIASNDELKIAVKNMISVFASAPRRLLENNSKRGYFVVDSFSLSDGQLSGLAYDVYPFTSLIDQDPFVVFSLENMVNIEEASKTFWHESQHGLDRSACRPIESDKEYRDFNPEWFEYSGFGQKPEERITTRGTHDYVVATPYSVKSTSEDKADAFANVMITGLSPTESVKGKSPLNKKQELIIKRNTEILDLPQLPALIELRRIYGVSTHPKSILSQHIAPFVDTTWVPDTTLGLDERLDRQTPLGSIVIYCNYRESSFGYKFAQRCGASFTAAVVDTSVVSQDSWYQPYQQALENELHQIMRSENLELHGSVYEEVNKDLPQTTNGQFVYYMG